MRRVPFSEPLWRPERVRLPDGREDRAEVLQGLDNLAPVPALRFRGVADLPEFRDGYLARVRERICPPPAQEEPAEKPEPLRYLRSIVGR